MPANLAYQEPLREELIDGRLVAMSPRPAWNHNRIAFNIAKIFEDYLEGKQCVAVPDGTDLYLDDKNWFVPDFMVVCDPDKIQKDGVHGAPDLVAEVLSPSTAKNDLGPKKETYAKCGVQEYWIISPEDKRIEVYHLKDGQFDLHDVYAVHEDWEMPRMNEEERAAVVTHFKCSLYDDLNIPLDRIFYRTF